MSHCRSRLRKSPLILALALLAVPDLCVCPFGHLAAADPLTVSRTDHVVTIKLDWAAIGTERSLRVLNQRITEDDTVIITAIHFNYLRHALTLTVDTKVLDAYKTLEHLWTGVLIPGSNLKTSASTDDFATAMKNWYERLASTDNQLTQALNKHTELLLTDADIADLTTTYAASFAAANLELVTLRAAALTAALSKASADGLAVFDKIDSLHSAVLARITTFTKSLAFATTGTPLVVGKKASGTVVTATLVPAQISTDKTAGISEATSSVSIEYLSASQLPLEFHAGYCYSTLKDFRFDQLQTATGDTIYLQVRDAKKGSGLVAFLSYALKNWPGKASPGLLLSLGTDLGDPGKTLFAGLSLRAYQRYYLTAGATSAIVAQGGTAALDPSLSNTTIYKNIAESRQWAFFFAVSFGLY